MKTEHFKFIEQQDIKKPLETRIDCKSDQQKVSVMIISYNQKEFVAEAIESSINQDYENLEVVISDDGSTDGTAEIIAQLQVKYPTRLVALLNKDNVGITRNCNRALRACTGDFITLVGGDDALFPGKITAQVEWFKKDDQRVLCGHAVQYVNANGSFMSYLDNNLYEGEGPEAYIHRTANLPGALVRASAIPSHGFDEAVPIASDFLFWIEVLSAGGKFGYVEGVYAIRRIHGANVSILKRTEMFDDLELTYNIIANRYPQYRAICADMIVKHVIYYLGVSELKRGRKLIARKQFLKTIRKKPFFLKAWLRLFLTI